MTDSIESWLQVDSSRLRSVSFGRVALAAQPHSPESHLAVPSMRPEPKPEAMRP